MQKFNLPIYRGAHATSFCRNCTDRLRPRRSLTQKMCQFMGGLVLAASTVLLSFTAHAQTFKAVPLDGGGWTSGFAQANNGRLYAYGDVFGAWRTDNGGTNWSYLNWNIPGGDIVGYGMAVQKDNADVVYYQSYSAIYKSTNGGTTWTKILSPLGDNLPRFRGSSPIMIRANNPNELWYAGSRKDLTGWLWRSQDGGSTWSKMGGSAFDNNRARTLHNVSAYPNQIWVGADDGLHVSTNGGASFTRVNTHPGVGMIQRFTSGTYAGVGLITRDGVNNDGGGISRITATDYANAATYTTTPSATSSIYFGYPTGLQIFSDGTCSAWNTAGDRHGFSTDGGQLFSVRATTLNTNPVPIWTTAAIMAAKNHPDYGTDQVIEDVTNANKWIITGGGAAMYSLDKGLSWQYFPNGSGIAAVKAYVAGVSRHDVNRIYIPASDIGSAIVTDGGASGQATRSSCKFFNTLHGSFRIMEGPDANNLVIAGVNQGGNSNLILKSADGGVNWSNANVGSTNLPASTDGITKSVMSLNSANDFLVMLSEVGSPAQRVYRTTNGGASFSGVSGLPDNSPTGGRYSPQNAFIERDATLNNVRYFVARGQDFYKSTDGGSNWSTIAHPNGGASGAWVWGLCADPVRSNNLWAASDWAGVKVSRDGGATWTPTAQYMNARHVSSCDGKIAVFGYMDGDAQPRLYFSSDDGATFTAQTNSANNFHGVQGLTVDRNGKIWVSWNSATVVTPVGAALSAPSIASQPSNATVTAGSSATFTVSASGNPSPTYQWQRAVTGSTTFSNLSNGGSYGGVTTSSLSVSSTTTAMSGDRFRVVATNSQGSATSSAATLTVNAATAAPVINSALTLSATVGTAISNYTITATNSPTSYNATNLPAGLSVNTSTGVISGTPTTAGTVNTTISATNSGGTGSATLVFTISAEGGSGPNRATGGTSSTSSTNSPGNEGVAQAFDGNVNTKWLTFASSGWIQYNFASGTSWTITTYAITSANDFAERDPRNWTLQGSNNGSTWTTVDTRSNETFSARFERRVFTVASSGNYSAYRLNVTSNQSGTILQLAELEFYSSTSSTSGTGLRGQYFPNMTFTGSPALTRTDATVDFSWSGSPGAGIGADGFSVRWEGEVETPVTGSYVFSTVSDDGVRLWVNGNQVINNWSDHAPTTDNSAGIALAVNTKYSVRMEFYENGGGAEARLRWSYPGQTSVAIPSTRLYPATGTSSARISASDAANVISQESDIESITEVYPNPANGSFDISVSGNAATITISSMQGKIMQQTLAKEKVTKFDSSNWPSGVYIIRIQSGSGLVFKKVIVN
jgi:hypothetical protein